MISGSSKQGEGAVFLGASTEALLLCLNGLFFNSCTEDLIVDPTRRRDAVALDIVVEWDRIDAVRLWPVACVSGTRPCGGFERGVTGRDFAGGGGVGGKVGVFGNGGDDVEDLPDVRASELAEPVDTRDLAV